MVHDQWPPLEQVREWAEHRLVSGRESPAATGKYARLIGLIDEILATQGQASDQECSGLADDGELSRGAG